MNVTLIRYGEIALKSKPVRKMFENILINNIKAGLEAADLKYKVRKDFGRIFIEGYNKKIEPILKRVFGIVSFSPCEKIKTDINQIKRMALRQAKFFKKRQTFAIRCNRVGKHEFTSQDVERLVGAEIVKKLKLKVNLTKPNNIVGIDIRDQDAYIFSKTVKCQGGLPVGTAGKVACLIRNSNDIIAAWLFMKRGCLITPVFITKSWKKCFELLQRWYIGHKLNPCFIEKISARKISIIIKKSKSQAIVIGEILSDFKDVDFSPTIFRPLVGFNNKDLKNIKNIMAG